MDALTKAIKTKTNMGVYEFIEKVLKTSYNAFFYRYRNGSIKLHEYILILEHTEMTFEELFVKGFKIELPDEIKIVEPPKPSTNKAYNSGVDPNQEVPQEPEEPKDQPDDDLPYIDTFEDINQKD